MVARMLLALSAALSNIAAATPAPVVNPTPKCETETNFDIVGQDIKNVQGQFEECCGHCANTPNCTAWAWTAPHSGTCWLKSGADKIIVNVNVKIGLAISPDAACMLYDDVDFIGNDIGNVQKSNAGDCCDVCKTTNACRAFSWSDYKGGTCWLKSSRDRAFFKKGVKSADAYGNVGPFSNPVYAMEQSVDYIDNDIGSVPARDPYDCGKICTTFKNDKGQCTAYSWNDYQGGTCWLKSKKDKTQVDTGVTSGSLVNYEMVLE